MGETKNISHHSIRWVGLKRLVITVLLIYGLTAIRTYLINPNRVAASSLNCADGIAVYDPVVLSISGGDIQSGLIRYSRDAQMEYQLLLRAGYQHQEKIAYQTMDQLRQKSPKNPVVLAGYFMAFKMAEGGVNSLRYNGGRQVMSFNSHEDDEAMALLQSAYRLAPNLWLIYAVDGEDKLYNPGGNKNQAIALLQKSADLAPNNPYTHWLLGDAYTNPPLSRHKYEMAAEECKKSLDSGGRISSLTFRLKGKHRFTALAFG